MKKQEKQELKELKYLARTRIKKGGSEYRQAYCFLGFEPGKPHKYREPPDNGNPPEGCQFCGGYWQCLVQKMLYLENKALKEKKE